MPEVEHHKISNLEALDYELHILIYLYTYIEGVKYMSHRIILTVGTIAFAIASGFCAGLLLLTHAYFFYRCWKMTGSSMRLLLICHQVFCAMLAL